MVTAAHRLRETGAAPGSPAFEGLFGPIDESVAVDDPSYVLARQLAVDEVVSVVSASAEKEVIEPAEAEAWLKLLGMTLTRRAAELGVRTEHDRETVGVRDEAIIQVVYALQLGLIDVLDDVGS